MKNTIIPSVYFANIDPQPIGSKFFLIELRRKDNKNRHDSVLVWKHPLFLRLRIMLALRKMLKRQQIVNSIVTDSNTTENPACAPESKTENSPKPISDAT